MKNLAYEFSIFPQIIPALFAFVLNIGIPYLAGGTISWLTTILVTVSVFLAAGVRPRQRR